MRDGVWLAPARVGGQTGRGVCRGLITGACRKAVAFLIWRLLYWQGRGLDQVGHRLGQDCHLLLEWPDRVSQSRLVLLNLATPVLVCGTLAALGFGGRLTVQSCRGPSLSRWMCRDIWKHNYRQQTAASFFLLIIKIQRRQDRTITDVTGLPGIIICKALWASFGQEKRYIRTAYY